MPGHGARVLPLELVPVPGHGDQISAWAPTKSFVQTRARAPTIHVTYEKLSWGWGMGRKGRGKESL